MILRGSLFSKVLDMATGVSVLVPDSLGAVKGYKKVVYLLHGLCGNNGNWLDNSMLPVYASKYDAVFVMPEVGRSFYSDMLYGQKFFSYVTEELPFICKNVFNISSRRDDTFVMGGSMGGYGALKIALAYPERYGGCCAFAPGPLYLKEFLEAHRNLGGTEEFRAQWGQLVDDFKGIFGEGLVWKPEDEPMELAKGACKAPLKPEIFVCCGTEDPLLSMNRQFRDDIESLGFDFTYEEMSGKHDFYFFDQALKRSLEFLFVS